MHVEAVAASTRRRGIVAVAEHRAAECRSRLEQLEQREADEGRRAVAAVREQLEGGGQVASEEATDIGPDLAAARRDLGLAERARAELVALADEAERVVAQCRKAIEDVALIVIEVERLVVRDELAATEATAEALRQRLWSLMPDRRYSSHHWPAPLQALLSDPEAVIREGVRSGLSQRTMVRLIGKSNPWVRILSATDQVSYRHRKGLGFVTV